MARRSRRKSILIRPHDMVLIDKPNWCDGCGWWIESVKNKNKGNCKVFDMATNVWFTPDGRCESWKTSEQVERLENQLEVKD